MKKELENAKTALTGDVVELDSQMSEVSNDLLEVQNLLDTKEAELEKTTKENSMEFSVISTIINEDGYE